MVELQFSIHHYCPHGRVAKAARAHSRKKLLATWREEGKRKKRTVAGGSPQDMPKITHFH